MSVHFFYLCFDQIFHELLKGRVLISFVPFPPSRNTYSRTVFSYKSLLYSGANLKLIPVGRSNPSEGVSADHEGSRILKLVDVGTCQSPGPLPEDCMELEEVLIIACILDIRNKEPGE